jgi:hypothetical protein
MLPQAPLEGQQQVAFEMQKAEEQRQEWLSCIWLDQEQHQQGRIDRLFRNYWG